MKIPLFITILVAALFACSCRTYTPLDPNTMEPSDRCLPAGPQYATVEATK